LSSGNSNDLPGLVVFLFPSWGIAEAPAVGQAGVLYGVGRYGSITGIPAEMTGTPDVAGKTSWWHTHGAFGALAYGIGTSEVEHVLATQTLIQRKSKNMRAVIDGKLPPDLTSKDIILAIIGENRLRRRHWSCVWNSPARPSARSRWKAA